MNYLPFIHYQISGYSTPNSILFSFKVYKCKQVVHSLFFQEICNSRKFVQFLMLNSFFFCYFAFIFCVCILRLLDVHITCLKFFHYVCLIHVESSVELRRTKVARGKLYFQWNSTWRYFWYKNKVFISMKKFILTAIDWVKHLDCLWKCID